MPPAPEAAGFAEMEAWGWLDAARADAYASLLGHLTQGALEALLDAAGITADSAVIDVACGPGYGAAAAEARGAQVVGADLSPAMIALAQQRFPTLAFRVAPGDALPIPDASVDAVISNFGVPHFPSVEAFFAEARRVLRPGGRLAWSNWDAGGFSALTTSAKFAASLGNPGYRAPLPEGPNRSDAKVMQAVMVSAGFDAVTLTHATPVWVGPTADVFLESVRTGTVRNAHLMAAQSPEQMAAIRSAVVAAFEPYRQVDGLLHVPAPAFIISGGKPRPPGS